MKTTIKDWTIEPVGNEYLIVSFTGKPGEIRIKMEDEGFVVDLVDESDNYETVASTYATYAELEGEEK